MKGQIGKNELIDKKLKKDLEGNILPDEFNIIDIVIKGKRVVANINSMLKISNTENKSEIIAAMNKVASNYQYFSRVESALEDIVIRKEEIFDLWLADKMSTFTDKDSSSEAAKKRNVMVKYKKEYEEYNNELNDLKYMRKQADIAKKSLDKQISLIQSIGAMCRSNRQESSPTSGSEDY